MGFKQRRAKAREAEQPAAEFEHSSGANTLEGLLGEHTLNEEAAEPNAPKGYRARSIAKATENRKAG
jgi:hypothetical protein